MFRARMHRRRSFFKRGLAMVSFLGLGGMLAACSPARARGEFDEEDISAIAGKRIDRALDEIDATPEQRQQIKAITDKLVNDGLAMRGKHGEVRDALHEQWGADQVDAEALHALVDERIGEFQSLSHQVVDAMAEIHDILTPEQRAQLSALMEERADRHHGRCHRGWGGRGAEL